ncbi:MAG: cytochrome c peroxidase [Kofleriaceae bacterium]
MIRPRLPWLVTAAALAACSGKPADKSRPVAGSGDEPATGSGSGSAAVGLDHANVRLPPAPPVPPPPAALPSPRAEATPTPAMVALGEALFFEPRLAADDRTSCATCHDPDHDFAGTGVQATATGKPNLRHAPSLRNLAWQRELGWDGRYPALKNVMLQHWRGQLGLDPSLAIQKLADVPLYRAHFQRAAQREPDGGVALEALAAFAITRFSGDAPWDRVERGELPEDPTLRAGYALFTGKAQCATCHPPPLYTDLGYHRLGLIASPDDGRGRVDRDASGAFKTPSLRGAASRLAFFHDGSATSLEAAIDWHLAGGVGQGADRSIVDPALAVVELTPTEREQLIAFVRALTPTSDPYPRPLLVP